MTQTNSIKAVLDAACIQLSAFDTARLDCEVLLCSLLDLNRGYLYAHPEQTLSSHLICDFNSLIEKRHLGYPVSYLTGRKEFWSISYLVNSYTLIPRPETELLVEQVLDLVSEDTPAKILDLGTGSGAIAIALARERPNYIITAIDISAEALATAKENAVRHGVGHIHLRISDWFSALGNEIFDVIVCNPPYIESGDRGLAEGEIRFEPRIALDGGQAGLNALNFIVSAATKHLKRGGRLLAEHGYNQGSRVRQLFKHSRYHAIQTGMDYSGHERYTFASY